MSENNVSANYFRMNLVYDAETGDLRYSAIAGARSGQIAGGQCPKGYRRVMFMNRQYPAHRIAWLLAFGEWPTLLIDHRNGVRNDNRISNLRESTRRGNRENQHVARSDSATGFMGVSKRGIRFRATLRVEGRNRYLGSFETPEEAHSAVIKAKRVFHVAFEG